RELLLHAKGEREEVSRPLVKECLSLGWGLLAEEPGRELVMGAVTRPWEAIAHTETRVLLTDAVARSRFRRYWALVSPGVVLIRRQSLRIVKADAERLSRG